MIKIDVGTILDRSILTSALSAGFDYLLTEEDYSLIAELLRFRSFDFKPAYFSIIKRSDKPFMLNIYRAYNSGFLCKEDARTLLPSEMVSSNSEMEVLGPNELAKLPVNPFSGVQDYFPYHLNEVSLIAALHRGLQERDPEMNWTAWPTNTPLIYELVWNQPELWRSLLMEMFCDAQHAVKLKILFTLKKSIERVQFPSKASIDNLIMINVTVIAFFFEFCRMAKHFHDSRQIYVRFMELMKELNDEFISLYKSIKDHRVTKDHGATKYHELFKGLDLNSSKIVYNSNENLQSNPFYYEERIKLFAEILERLKRIPDVFADWFINFLTVFFDVVPKMSLKLLIDTWGLFLSFRPTIRAISTLISWFQGRINEEYRLELSKMIPKDMILLFYRNCENIPSPTTLISYSIRKSEYLKTNRIGSYELFSYYLSSFWTPRHTNLVKLLKLFQLMRIGMIDLFESTDIVFELESKTKEVSLKRFIEIVLEMFISIKEWTMLVSSDLDVVIPSALFPPSFGPLLAQLIVRCRHLNCSAPFKISEPYLILFQSHISAPEPSRLDRFVKSHLKFLSQSDGSRLPRLTKAYQMYFSMVTSYVEPNEPESIYLEHDENTHLFFNHHLRLFQLMNHLKLESSPVQGNVIELQLHEVITKTLMSFGTEMYDLLKGSNIFNQEEIYSFLYN